VAHNNCSAPVEVGFDHVSSPNSIPGLAFGCIVNLFLISFRPSRRVMKERNPINEQEGMAVETPVTIQILSSAENTYLLQSRLKDILVDASGCCEYMGYVDQNGYVRVKIECIVSGQEKQQSWDQLTKLPI
jgi:hypothetical protein